MPDAASDADIMSDHEDRSDDDDDELSSDGSAGSCSRELDPSSDSDSDFSHGLAGGDDDPVYDSPLVEDENEGTEEEGKKEEEEEEEDFDPYLPPSPSAPVAAAVAPPTLGPAALKAKATLQEPAWNVGGVRAPYTVGQLASGLLQITSDSNLTKVVRSRLYEFLRRSLPRTSSDGKQQTSLPTYREIVQLVLDASPVTSRAYVACHSDCELAEMPINPVTGVAKRFDQLTPAEIKQLQDKKCTTCQETFGQGKHKRLKVSARLNDLCTIASRCVNFFPLTHFACFVHSSSFSLSLVHCDSRNLNTSVSLLDCVCCWRIRLSQNCYICLERVLEQHRICRSTVLLGHFHSRQLLIQCVTIFINRTCGGRK